MDSALPAPSVLDSLRTVEFRLGLKGYNVDEVDEYLEKAAVEAEALHEQLRQQGERLRQATERITQLEADRRVAPPAAAAPAAASDESLQRTLLLAQKFVEQTQRESEAEAADVLARAEERARGILGDAENRAHRLTTEAEQRLREEVKRLEDKRGQLATDVENMAHHLQAERDRLRSTLAEVLRWVDENIHPEASLKGLSPGREPSSGGARPSGPPPGPARSSEPAERPAPARPAPSVATPASQAGSGPIGGAPGTAAAGEESAQVFELRSPTSTPAAGAFYPGEQH